MKKLFVIISIIIVIVISFCSAIVIADKFFDTDKQKILDAAKKAKIENKTVVAIVEGEKIYQETIDFLAVGEEISQKNTASIVGDENLVEGVDKQEILNKQIRDMVVFTEAKKNGLEATDEEARKYTLENYEMVKEFDPDGYRFLLDYMDEMNITEEKYLDLLIDTNKEMLTRAKLYDKFAEGKSGTYDEIVAEYEKYVEDLISKADIEYK